MMNLVESPTLPNDFPHESPAGYEYEVRQYKRNILSIWLRHLNQYTYNGGDPVSTIWGFYDSKKQCYFSPVHATKPGNKVDVNNTRPYTSMPLNLNPLEAAFL